MAWNVYPYNVQLNTAMLFQVITIWGDLFIVRSADKDRYRYHINDDNTRWRKQIKISESSIFKDRLQVIANTS